MGLYWLRTEAHQHSTDAATEDNEAIGKSVAGNMAKYTWQQIKKRL